MYDEQLTEKDYLILKYINSLEIVSMLQLQNHFKGKIESIDFRLRNLETQGCILPEYYDVISDFVSFPKDKYFFRITPFGKTVIQDCFINMKRNKIHRLVTLVTLVATIIGATASIISVIK